MTAKEFNLSDKARNSNILLENKPVIMYMEYDIKEFIKILKWRLGSHGNPEDSQGNIIEGIIDKLAGVHFQETANGDKLI